MQPIIINVDGTPHQFYQDVNGALYRAAPIQQYALRRVFNLAVNTPKIIDFVDLQGYWDVDSVYISSPEDSEIVIEMLDEQGIVFYTDKLLRNQTPKTFPTVLVNNSLTMRLTAKRSAINLLLLYLKPAHLAHAQDF